MCFTLGVLLSVPLFLKDEILSIQSLKPETKSDLIVYVEPVKPELKYEISKDEYEKAAILSTLYDCNRILQLTDESEINNFLFVLKNIMIDPNIDFRAKVFVASHISYYLIETQKYDGQVLHRLQQIYRRNLFLLEDQIDQWKLDLQRFTNP